MKTIEKVLIEIANTCDSLGIGYAVMGGLAVRIHGIPRPTFDVDLTVVGGEHSLYRLFDAVEALGYTVPGQYRTGWMDRVADMPIVKLRTWLAEGQGIDVDLFVSETPFQHSLMNRKMRFDFDGHPIWVISPEDLILLKLLANRKRDLGDVVDVIFMQGQLDEDYMRSWARRMEISDRLEKALAEIPGT